MRHRIRSLAILATITLILGASQAALAAGTPAWTIITNTASVTYSVGGVVQADTPTGSVDITVDRKVAFSVTSVSNTATNPGATDQALFYKITNDGNAPLDFGLDALNLGGDVYNAAILNVYAETDGTPGYNSTNDTATFVDYLMPGYNTVVYVVADIPTTSDGSTPLVSTDNAIVQFTATAYNSAWTDGDADGIPSAGEGNGSLDDGPLTDDSGDANGKDTVETVIINGTASATGEYIITAAQISVSKTVNVVSDPTGAVDPLAKAIPGAILEYTITVTNTGTVDVESVKLSDPIPTNTSYVANSTELDTVAQADVGGTSPMASGAGLDLGTITKAGGADPHKVVTFRVTVD